MLSSSCMTEDQTSTVLSIPQPCERVTGLEKQQEKKQSRFIILCSDDLGSYYRITEDREALAYLFCRYDNLVQDESNYRITFPKLMIFTPDRELNETAEDATIFGKKNLTHLVKTQILSE